MSNIAFTVNNQPIEWSFYKKVVKVCSGDYYRANRVFFRARDKAEVIPWIVQGLQPPEYYALKACPAEYDGSKQADSWIDKVIIKIKPSPEIKILKDLNSRFAMPVN